MRRASILIACVALLAGCRVPMAAGSPQPSPPPTPTPSGIPAADRSGPEKVAAMLFPDGGSACGHAGNYNSCPFTPELRRRLNAGPIPYVDQLCRCTGQYHAPKFTVTPVSDGAVVKVDLALDKGAQSLDLSLTHPQGVWVVWDITCSGRGTSTSVFSDSPTQCFASSG
jgi:hypothetical protein